MFIACVQSDVSFADPDSNRRRVLEWMKRASDGASPADLVVFPECMLTGYTFDSREAAAQTAISIESPIFESISEAAAEFGQFVTLGFLESSGKQLFNSAALIGPDGIVGCYRKIHLPHLGVDRFVDRGDRPYQSYVASSIRSDANWKDARIGLAICYDSSFPEPMRVLGLAGADIIALGTNWPVEAPHTPEIVPPARSMENHLYFVASNRIGTENGVRFCGRSSICGPDGVIMAKSNDDSETLLMADVDINLARNKEIQRNADLHKIHRFDDRRPEFYGSIIE